MEIPSNSERFMVFDPESSDTVWSDLFTDYVYAPYNPPRSFSVTKRDTGDTYIVDLEDCGGKGSCCCEDFAYRRDPANAFCTNPHTECKHLKAIRMLIRCGVIPVV